MRTIPIAAIVCVSLSGCAHYEAVSSAQRLFVTTPATFSYTKDISSISRSELRQWVSANDIQVESLPQEVQSQLRRGAKDAVLLKRIAPRSATDGRWNFNERLDAVWLPIDCEPGTTCNIASYILMIPDTCEVKNEICACHQGACTCTEWCGVANPCPAACAGNSLVTPCL